MKLKVDQVASSQAQRSQRLREDDLGVSTVLHKIGLWCQAIGKGPINSVQHLRSGLVGGIGFVNLYRITFDGLSRLHDLELDNFKQVKIGGLGADIAQRLFEYLGDLSDSEVYLLEYPEGYLLTHNDNILAFKYHGHHTNHSD